MDASIGKEIVKQGSRVNSRQDRPSALKKYRLKSISVHNRSLRMYVVPRMPTEREIIENTVVYELLCAICHGPCIDDYVHCRVCIKIHHSQCLYGPIDPNEPLSFSLRFDENEKSCPECEDLTRLLTQDEIRWLIYTFEQLDRNKDGFITLKEFLTFISNGKRTDGFHLSMPNHVNLEKTHFNLIDSNRIGGIIWPDFLRFYGCKFIAMKNKIELTTKLSIKELVFAKRLFIKDPSLKIDSKLSVVITKNYFNELVYDLVLKIKKKYGGDFIDTILPENLNIDEFNEELAVIRWEEYLCQICIPILLNRPNYQVNCNALCPIMITYELPETIVDTSYLDLKKDIVVTPVTSTPLDLSFIKLFREYRKSVELEEKHPSSLIDYSIVENVEGKNSYLPKLKSNARDGRQTISELWSVVKDMEHIRNKPVLLTTIPINMSADVELSKFYNSLSLENTL